MKESREQGDSTLIGSIPWDSSWPGFANEDERRLFFGIWKTASESARTSLPTLTCSAEGRAGGCFEDSCVSLPVRLK